MRDSPEEEGAELHGESPIIMSPTGVTNSIRRDRDKSKSPGRQGPAAFLAAEQFQEVVGRSRSGSASMGKHFGVPIVETVEEELPPDRSSNYVACKAPVMRRPRSCNDVKNVAAEVQQAAYSVPYNEKYVKPAEEKVKNMVHQARERVPDEEQVRGCFRETRRQGDNIARYANLVYDMFAQECQPNAVRGDQRGEDAMFFRYGSPATSGDKSRSFSQKSPSPTPEDAFRSPKSMRYPQAAKIRNPVERSERKLERGSSGRRDSSEETREDTTDSMEDDDSFDLGNVMNKGDDQVSLREVRLQMYKVDDGARKVPRARLSRALGELSLQDSTIETLQMKLEDTKTLLHEKETRLAEAQVLSKQHEMEIQELIARTSEDTRTLEAKISKECTEKGKLQSKVDVLQKEVYRLKAALDEKSSSEAHTTSEGMKSTSILAAVAKGDLKRTESEESQTDGEVWEGILSEDEADAIEVSLRAEVVSLKSQLADSQAELMHRSGENSQATSRNSKGSSTSRDLSSSSDVSEEISRLRQKLTAAETELAALRGTEQRSQDAEERVEVLRQQLAKTEQELLESTNQLEQAMAREAELRRELEEAVDKIAFLESERDANIDSIVEAEDLKLLRTNDNEEAEKVKSEALLELEKSRAEVDELKEEVRCLTQTIHEMTTNSALLTEERLRERDRLEEALHRCKDTEHQLRDQVQDLEERLEKAETSTRQLANVSESPDSRSVKRKLDESMDSDTGLVTRESFQLEERAELKEQLKRSQAVEDHLRSEMAITRQLLHCAEEVVAEMESEMKEDSRLRSENESRLVDELNSLRDRLEASENKTREAIAQRNKESEEHSKMSAVLRQSEIKQQALLNQVRILKTALQSVERERQQEKLEVQEERRIHEDLEEKSRKEIDVLRVELANVRAKAEKSTQLQAEVDDLRVRLANAQVQSEEAKKSASKEGQKKEEESSKLRSELSVIKQRLATIRQRNASRRRKMAPKDDSSTDDLSTSGESVQSIGFSSPSFSPRRMGGSTSVSTPSTMTRSPDPKSAEASPWPSPQQRPLGSFPSPPRKRVDVSSLRQRLMESNQRLQDANTRLNGLAKSSNDMVQQQVKTESLNDEIMTLVAQNSNSDASVQSPDRSFHKKLQVRIVENTAASSPRRNISPAVYWPTGEEGSI